MRKILFFCVLIITICNTLVSQNHEFVFEKIDESKITYDFEKYSINIDLFATPDTNYISEVIQNKGKAMYSRSDCDNEYVFPIRISYKDSVFLVTVTYSGFLDLFEKKYFDYFPNGEISIKQALLNKDTLVVDSLPSSVVGSANYQILYKIDPEFSLFKSNKWLFLNFFFKKNESGLQYEFIGHDIQIPAVVFQLYSWGILVSDECGGDNHSTIYIESYNYPHFDISDKPSDVSWVINWMSRFKDKHVIGAYVFDRLECEMWNNEWWNTK